jgi:hypothetical protein
MKYNLRPRSKGTLDFPVKAVGLGFFEEKFPKYIQKEENHSCPWPKRKHLKKS